MTFSLCQVRYISHVLLLLYTYAGRVRDLVVDYLLWIPSAFMRSG